MKLFDAGGAFVLGLASLPLVAMMGCPMLPGDMNDNVNMNSSDNANMNGTDANANDNATVNENDNGGSPTVGDGEPADDLWTTPAGSRTSYSFLDTPLPADFFGQGSDLFDGTVDLMGAALDPALGPADTIVRRLQDICPAEVGETVTVDVEIVALSLVSVEPITVTFNGGQLAEQWDVEVCLSSFPQETGSMTITLDEEDCGTFDSNIPVLPKFTFIRRSTGAGQFVDCGERDQLCEGLDLEGEDNDWVLIGGPADYDPASNGILRTPAGVQIDADCDGQAETMTLEASSCFQAGMSCRGGFECTFNEEAEGRLDSGAGGQHTSFINSEDDIDSDGWPNDCDNCPEDASPDQTDSDGDGLGDICDNCPDDDNPDQADGDADNIGDVCDNCPDISNEDQADADDNGVGDACEGIPGEWEAVLGVYVLSGSCEGSGQTVTLAAAGDLIVLQGLPGNDDITLTCDGATATGANVTAFGQGGHDLTLTIDGVNINLSLLQPETLGSCSSTLTPQ